MSINPFSVQDGEITSDRIIAPLDRPCFIITENIEQKTWAFDQNGVLVLPNGNGCISGIDGADIYMAGGVYIGQWDVKIKAFDFETSSTSFWDYNRNGSITFPDGSVQTTAFTGTSAIPALPLYTTSTLSTISSTATGVMVLVTDLAGGGLPCFFDGTSWKTMSGTAI